VFESLCSIIVAPHILKIQAYIPRDIFILNVYQTQQICNMYDVKLSRRLIIALMMGTETVPETLDFNELTRLSAREEFIKFVINLEQVKSFMSYTVL
jgi:hypothetical protein